LALGLATASTTPARADGGATAAIIIGAATLTTIGCYDRGSPVLCALSPVFWVDTIIHPRGHVYVKSRKRK
jgi:hypothetical protein